ncbi:MAG TPA: hypothetical protein VN625_03775 [Desulfuromonadaceae bacterium]|nr:hypothetical protein [Desulfuromonadaceae bacterium]
MTFPSGIRTLFILAIALAFAGCATQKVNWQTRVGTYTYDQAIQDFGPPDKSAQLEDGSTVSDWMIREGHTVIAPRPYMSPIDGFGPASAGYSQTYIPSYYMRLTFGPDKKLKEFKNFSR